MSNNYFLTGTDTDCGKTLIAAAILHKAKSQGFKSLGLKPVAAGANSHCDPVTSNAEGLANDDACLLIEASSEILAYSQVNPVLLKQAIAPHIAANNEGRRISISSLTGYVRGAMLQTADLRIIEGAGGWMVPINNSESLNNLAQQLKTPVILVVGMQLGCLNHALLTAKAIAADGLRIAAWVATETRACMPSFNENIATLKQLLPAPCLGVIRYETDISYQQVAEQLDISAILPKIET